MLEDGEVESWATSEFAKSPKAKDKEAYREAKGKVADLKTDVGDHPDVAKVLMRSLVNTMGIMSDSVRAKLGPTRPRTASPGESRFAGRSIEITLCENKAPYFDTLLGMCGFSDIEDDGDGAGSAFLPDDTQSKKPRRTKYFISFFLEVFLPVVPEMMSLLRRERNCSPRSSTSALHPR